MHKKNTFPSKKVFLFISSTFRFYVRNTSLRRYCPDQVQRVRSTSSQPDGSPSIYIFLLHQRFKVYIHDFYLSRIILLSPLYPINLKNTPSLCILKILPDSGFIIRIHFIFHLPDPNTKRFRIHTLCRLFQPNLSSMHIDHLFGHT